MDLLWRHPVARRPFCRYAQAGAFPTTLAATTLCVVNPPPLGSGPADGPASPLAAPASGQQPARALRAALAAGRHPVIAVLALISFFTTISGKPLDGLLMLAAASGLAWDRGRRRRHSPVPPPAAPGEQPPPGSPPAVAAPTVPAPGGRRPAGRRRWLLTVGGLAAGAVYAVTVGSFTRYSWPATIAVTGLGAGLVARGWRGPARRHPDPGPLPRAGLAAWGGILAAGGLWELSALLQQPALDTGSYAHPTISTLADPLLAAAPGRSLMLVAWLALGWYLARR
jgi:hypothetical protein